MVKIDWLERVAALPQDNGMTVKFLADNGISFRTLQKLMKSPLELLENETEKQRRATYRKTVNFYQQYDERMKQRQKEEEQSRQENEKKLQEVWNNQLKFFYRMLSCNEYQKAYEKLKWLFQNKKNNVYDRDFKLNFILLEEVLSLKESYIDNMDFVIKSASVFQNGHYYYKYFDEFAEMVYQKDWEQALEAIKLFRIFEKSHLSQVNSRRGSLYINLINAIVEKNNEKQIVVEKNFDTFRVDSSKIFSLFYNMVREGAYERAYKYLITMLNEKDSNNNSYKMYIRIYCILLEVILGYKNSKRDEMQTIEFNESVRKMINFGYFESFKSAVEIGNFEDAYKNLIQYKVGVERREMTSSLPVNVCYFLICEVTNRDRLPRINLNGFQSKNVVNVSEKWISAFNNLRYYVEKRDYIKNCSNILDCLEVLESFCKKDKVMLSFLGQFKSLIMVYHRERLSSGYVYDLDMDKLDDNFKFEELIKNGAYYQAFKYVGKVLCARDNDEFFKLYAKVLIDFGSILTKGEIKVVLNNDKVDNLVCNRRYEKLMEIFKVVGKDNLSLEYIPIYNIVESMLDLKNGEIVSENEKADDDLICDNVVYFFSLLEQKKYFEAYDCLRKIPVGNIYFWETYNYLLMDLLKLQMDLHKCSMENTPKIKNYSFNEQALGKCEDLENAKVKVLNRECYKIRVRKFES